MRVALMDPEEEPNVEYRAYHIQSFDDEEDEAAAPDPERLPDPESGFEPRQDTERSEGTEGAGSAGGGPFAEAGHAAAPPGETDFASIKFQRENTLLTNAEHYAASIREEAELYVRQLREEADALDRETQQRYEEARRTREEAEAEAGRITAEAETRAQEIRDQAYQEGIAAGQEEGRRQRYEEAAPALERLESLLTEIEQYRSRLAYYTEKDGVRLALLMAKKILRAELKLNKQAILKLLAATLAELEGMGTFRVWLNPEDHRFALAARPQLERFLDEDQALTLRAKPDVPAGNILIETDREVIDLTFQSQFYHLERLLGQELSERETVLLGQGRRSASRPVARGNAGAPGGPEAAAQAPGATTGATAGRRAGDTPGQAPEPTPEDAADHTREDTTDDTARQAAGDAGDEA